MVVVYIRDWDEIFEVLLELSAKTTLESRLAFEITFTLFFSSF